MIFGAVIATMAMGYSTPRKEKRESADRDTALFQKDSVEQDSFVVGGNIADSAATAMENNGPDTTKMDSMQLAIYRHNKAIDDSLAFD
ncbi:MAG: hypothetical protein J6B47_08190, partial [Prevotella sp.]|nr:hypothetical protein [Prevotella sp.]